jgi:hypothetical protein
MSKTLGIIVIVFACIFFFPIAIGIFGGIFGIIAGIFGGLIGLIGGIFGAIFGLLGAIFHIGAFTILVCLIIALLISRSNKAK